MIEDPTVGKLLFNERSKHRWDTIDHRIYFIIIFLGIMLFVPIIYSILLWTAIELYITIFCLSGWYIFIIMTSGFGIWTYLAIQIKVFEKGIEHGMGIPFNYFEEIKSIEEIEEEPHRKYLLITRKKPPFITQVISNAPLPFHKQFTMGFFKPMRFYTSKNYDTIKKIILQQFKQGY